MAMVSVGWASAAHKLVDLMDRTSSQALAACGFTLI